MKYKYVEDGMCEVCASNGDVNFAFESGMNRCKKHFTKDQKNFYKTLGVE